MNYKIVYVSTAEKELSKLQEGDFKKVQAAINSLSNNPFPVGYLKLEGTKNKLYRIRKGVEKNVITITILKIAHRKNVYRF